MLGYQIALFDFEGEIRNKVNCVFLHHIENMMTRYVVILFPHIENVISDAKYNTK